MAATYGLLFLAFAAVYLPAASVGHRVTVRMWQPCLLAALASGAWQGLVQWPALLAIAALWGSAELGVREAPIRHSATWRAVAVALAIALALHAVPGFPDPVIARDVRLTSASAAMTLRANFDKGAAALLLLAYFSPRPRARDWPRLLGLGVIMGALTAVLVIGLVAAFGYVRPDPKWTELALVWIPINLLLTCVFEEMLFRGLLQRWLRNRLAARPRLRPVPIAVSSVLFGLAHAGGGPLLIAAATVAGIGYGLAYERTQRIEAAILAHFTLNAAHFFLFTYPYAAR